jgi:hypothetical protein
LAPQWRGSPRGGGGCRPRLRLRGLVGALSCAPPLFCPALNPTPAMHAPSGRHASARGLAAPAPAPPLQPPKGPRTGRRVCLRARNRGRGGGRARRAGAEAADRGRAAAGWGRAAAGWGRAAAGRGGVLLWRPPPHRGGLGSNDGPGGGAAHGAGGGREHFVWLASRALLGASEPRGGAHAPPGRRPLAGRGQTPPGRRRRRRREGGPETGKARTSGPPQ